MLEEFKKFVMRGNVMDLAVGVIIGAAFGKIVTSLVNDILMPLIGLVMGNLNVSEMFYALDRNSYPSLQAARDAGAPVLAWGSFLQNIIDFLIVAFVIFLLVKGINRLTEKRAPTAPAAPSTKECPYCKSTIPVNAVRCPNCTSQLG